jgi:hypothetical protein
MAEQTQPIDWNTATWGAIGKDIIKCMEGREGDESFLKSLAEKAVATVKDREAEIDPHDPKKRPQQIALNQINRVIDKEYPRLDTATENYWYDSKGKQDLKKWRHNIFKYMTLGRGIKPIPNFEIETPSAPGQPAKEPADQSVERPLPTLKEMTIERLELDDETQATLETALSQSGMALPDFIRQAIKVYAKTIAGKNQKREEDLSTVTTDKLLSDPTYSTHPGRAEELTKRAIKVIKYYNANIATEKADRWCITQSAIASLTGSRASAIGKALEQYKIEIDDHNRTYELDGYSNRKPGKKIEEVVNLTELCPDGLD